MSEIHEQFDYKAMHQAAMVEVHRLMRINRELREINKRLRDALDEIIIIGR